MTQYVKMSLQDEASASKQGADEDFIIIEVDDQGGLASAQDAKDSPIPTSSFEKAVSKLGPLARTVLAQVTGLGLSEVKIELGIKFSADVGVILAKTSGEGTCKVSIGWTMTQPVAPGA